MDTVYSVISHTHWDREWYLTFEEFRVRLVDLLDNLLDILDTQPAYRFHLDAQSIVLEDYLAIRPYQRDKLKQYIAQGRILVGPWYVQNDFFLTSGEATVRNLLIGSALAEEFGRSAMVGYAPDQFGIIAQLPQIFRRFGIDSCLFARGYTFDQPVPSELYWEAEDGSLVLAVYMPYWYNNAQRFSADLDKAETMLRDIRRRLEQTAGTRHFLLMNGVDHLEAQEDLLPILEALNRRLPDNERIVQDTMPEYMERLARQPMELATYRGEMRFGAEGNLLAGTLSSRVYLKQWNAWCQTLIEKRLEPLYSWIDMAGANEYPKDFLHYLWKLLIENHPHDSICGCSIDRVHEHMMDRFRRFEETGNELLSRAMQFVSAHISRDELNNDQYLINAFNTNRQPQAGVLELDLEFPASEAVETFTIRDSAGVEIPYTVVRHRTKARGVLSPINLPGVVEVDAYAVRVGVPPVPGLSYRTFVVTPHEMPTKLQDEALVFGQPPVLENEWLRVTVNADGTIDLTDKLSDVCYTRLLAIEDREDTGHSYIYSCNPEVDPILSCEAARDVTVSVVEKSPLRSRVCVDYELDLPAAYDFERDRRSAQTEVVPVSLELTLEEQSPRLDVRIILHNQVKDHRMRLLVPTGLDTAVSQAGAPFDVVLRDRGREQAVKDQPNTNIINVDGNGYGLAVFNEGLYEYEHLDDEAGTLGLTLLRGNGFVSSSEPGMQVEERWMVPGNQCLGRHTLRVSLYPHKGDFYAAETAEMAQHFLNPLFASCHPVDQRKFSGGRPFVQDSDVSGLFFRDSRYPDLRLPMDGSPLDVVGEHVVLSCIKRAESDDGFVIRVYNSASTPTEFALRFARQPASVQLTTLREEPEAELAAEDGWVRSIQAKPKEIVTVKICF